MAPRALPISFMMTFNADRDSFGTDGVKRGALVHILDSFSCQDTSIAEWVQEFNLMIP